MLSRFCGGALLLAGPLAAQEAPPSWAELGPFFAERCTLCHAGEGAPLGLRLDSYEGAMAGSGNGPVLVPGDPEGSELIRRVRGISQPMMPLIGEPLSEAEIGRIEAWILAGLPEGGAEAAPAGAAAQEAGHAGTEPAGEPDIAGEPTAAALEEDTPEGAQVPEGLVAEAASEGVEATGPAEARPAPGEPVTFAHVEPIFLQRCVECHSPAREGRPPEGLRLDGLPDILAGGERIVVIPGNPEASEIVRRIEGTAEPRMPLDGPPWLSQEEIALIRRWIADGARDAEGEPAPVPAGREVRVRGTMTGPEEIDGIGFAVTGDTRIDDRPDPGEAAELRGVVTEDGGIEATRLQDR